MSLNSASRSLSTAVTSFVTAGAMTRSEKTGRMRVLSLAFSAKDTSFHLLMRTGTEPSFTACTLVGLYDPSAFSMSLTLKDVGRRTQIVSPTLTNSAE